jgi:hypothetical protein
MLMPITVAANSKACTTIAGSNSEVVGSSSARSVDVCVFILFVLSCV